MLYINSNAQEKKYPKQTEARWKFGTEKYLVQSFPHIVNSHLIIFSATNQKIERGGGMTKLTFFNIIFRNFEYLQAVGLP